MKLLVVALEELAALRHRFHDLVDPQNMIAAAVEKLSVATAEHVKGFEARLASLELAAGIASPSIAAAPVLDPPPADDTSPSSTEPSSAPPAVIQIPVSEEIKEAMAADPGPG